MNNINKMTLTAHPSKNFSGLLKKNDTTIEATN